MRTLLPTALVLSLSVWACAARKTPLNDRPALPDDAGIVSVRDAGTGSTDNGATVVVDVPKIDPPTLPARRPVTFPSFARRTIDHGIEVNVLEQHSMPLVEIHLVVRGAGRAAEPDDKAGLASLTAQMLTKGTVHHLEPQIAELFEQSGGNLNVETHTDATILSLTVLRGEIERTFLLLGEIVSEPTFEDAEVNRLRAREILRVDSDEDDPAWLADRALRAEVFTGHPYARYDASRESLGRINRNDISAFHHAHFVSRAFVIDIAGDVRTTDIVTLANRAFSHARRGNVPAMPLVPLPSHTTRTVLLMDRHGSTQSEVRVGSLGPAMAATDAADTSMAAQILGGNASARLFMDLREHRGLTYGAYATWSGFTSGGMIVSSLATRTEKTVEATKAVTEHLEKMLQSDPTADELDLGRRYLVDGDTFALESLDGVLDLQDTVRTHGLPDDYWAQRRTRFESITAEQVKTAAAHWMSAGASSIVVVGEASAVEEGLRALGTVRVVDRNGRTLRTLAAQP